MQDNFNHIDGLIGKYLTGEASPDEKVFIEHWIATHQDNKKYFDQLKILFEKSEMMQSASVYDTDAAWEIVKKRIDKKVKTVSLQSKPDNSFKFSRWWYAAASIILLAIAGILLLRSPEVAIPTATQFVAEKQSMSDTLPDGTSVFLNKHTQLAYTYDAIQKSRVIKLQGESYFEIKKSDESFLIETGGVYIRDIGTAFNVKSYPDQQYIEVVVEEGEVMFFSDNNKGLHLRASEKGIYNKNTLEFSIQQPEPNVMAYKTKQFSFQEIDLAIVVQTLNDVYEQQIVLDENLKKCKITVSFDNENAEEIAHVIAETLGLSIEHTTGDFRLKGSGCEK